MSEIVDGVSAFFSGILDAIVRNVTGFLILGLFIAIIYIILSKKPEINLGEELFNKFWDVTAETLKFKSPKQLILCPYPKSMNAEDLRDIVNQIHYEPIGDVVGVNGMGKGIDSSIIKNLSNYPDNANLKAIREQYEDKINNGDLWLVFAVKRKIGGKFLFPKVLKSLILVNPNQVINMSDKDNKIYVRGFGIHPIGEYDVVTDEDVIRTKRQARIDITHWIEEEGLLNEWGRLGDIVEKAIKGDSGYRKELARGSSIIAPQNMSHEAEI